MKNGVRAHFSPTNERVGDREKERVREMSVERKIKNSRLKEGLKVKTEGRC